MEEKFRGQIEEDWSAYTENRSVYLLTEETLRNFNWGGLLVSQSFKNPRIPLGERFED